MFFLWTMEVFKEFSAKGIKSVYLRETDKPMIEMLKTALVQKDPKIFSKDDYTSKTYTQDEMLLANSGVLMTQDQARQKLLPLYKDSIPNIHELINELFAEKIDMDFWKNRPQEEPILKELNQNDLDALNKAADTVCENLPIDAVLIAAGNTPYILAYLLELRGYQIIYLPFSGGGECFLERIVTIDQAKYMRKKWAEKGFTPEKFSGKINVIDSSSGRVIKHFLWHMAMWYQDLNLKMPDMRYFRIRNEVMRDLSSWNPGNCEFMVIEPLSDFAKEYYFVYVEQSLFEKIDDTGGEDRFQPHFKSIFWGDSFNWFYDLFPGKIAKELLRVIKEDHEKHPIKKQIYAT